MIYWGTVTLRLCGAVRSNKANRDRAFWKQIALGRPESKNASILTSAVSSIAPSFVSLLPSFLGLWIMIAKRSRKRRRPGCCLARRSRRRHFLSRSGQLLSAHHRSRGGKSLEPTDRRKQILNCVNGEKVRSLDFHFHFVQSFCVFANSIYATCWWRSSISSTMVRPKPDLVMQFRLLHCIRDMKTSHSWADT